VNCITYPEIPFFARSAGLFSSRHYRATSAIRVSDEVVERGQSSSVHGPVAFVRKRPLLDRLWVSSGPFNHQIQTVGMSNALERLQRLLGAEARAMPRLAPFESLIYLKVAAGRPRPSGRQRMDA
jgi:hypothetical protein